MTVCIFAVVHPLHGLVHSVRAGACCISCEQRHNGHKEISENYLNDSETTWDWFDCFCSVVNPQQEVLYIVHTVTSSNNCTPRENSQTRPKTDFEQG